MVSIPKTASVDVGMHEAATAKRAERHRPRSRTAQGCGLVAEFLNRLGPSSGRQLSCQPVACHPKWLLLKKFAC